MNNKKLAASYDQIRFEPERSEAVWAAVEAAHKERMRTRPDGGAGKLARVALIAALLSVFFITTAYALSGVVHSTGTYFSEHDEEFSSLRDLPKAEKIVGYPVTAPERLADDYRFLKMRIDGEAAFDENNDAIQPYYGLHVQYAAPGKELLFLDLTPVLELPTVHKSPEPIETRSVRGVEVRYSADHYKIVPEDYQKTEADLAAEAAGHFFLSFGGDEIEERDYEFADFVLDGVNYVLMDQNGDGPELLFRMAAEVISAHG